MKIIMLDFDGVLNSDETPDNLDFSKFAIQELNYLIAKTGAKIVVSSDWRKGRSVAELQSILELWGFVGEIIGKTQNLNTYAGWIGWETYLKLRVQEIEMYLSEHPEIITWIVIDDLPLLLDLEHFVRTNPEIGLTRENVEEVIRLLGGE